MESGPKSFSDNSAAISVLKPDAINCLSLETFALNNFSFNFFCASLHLKFKKDSSPRHFFSFSPFISIIRFSYATF